MRKHISRFISIWSFLFVFICTAQAQKATPELTARILRFGKRINLTLNTGVEDPLCRIKLYAAGQRKQLKKESPKFLITELANRSASFEFQIPSLKKIKRGKSVRNKKRIFFKYAVSCEGSAVKLSELDSVLVRKTKKRNALSARKWFRELKDENINNAFVIEQPFPNLEFRFPVDLKFPDDGTNRLFVVEKGGTIEVFENNSTVTTSTTFLDIDDRVKTTHEEGLLGLAFHPDYATNGFFYVYYTETDSGDSVISRFKVKDDNANEADASSELELFRIVQPSPVHQGGSMHFGPDGFLYISFGDGGAANDPNNYGQNMTNIYGSVIRIDVDATDEGNYGIPADNPFVGVSGADERIFAYGFRNPWRFSFDAETDEIWLADVGQGAYEEIDLVTAGGNYGWKKMEGMHCFEEEPDCDQTGLTLPIYEYSHEEGFSVTGGFVYRGAAIESLIGKYIYADFTVGKLWSLTPNGDEYENEILLDTELYISSFGVDEDNELYFLDYGNGKIHRFAAAG